MPVTPLHLGPALVLKSVAQRYFSIPTFAFTQVAIDSEVLVGLALMGDLSYHATLHTFVGATALAALAVLLYRPLICRLARLWNFISRAQPESIVYMATDSPVRIVALSAVIGSYSHVALDAVGNPEIAPFAPFAPANPFVMLAMTQGAVLLCLLCWLVGGCAVLALAYRRRKIAEDAA